MLEYLGRVLGSSTHEMRTTRSRVKRHPCHHTGNLANTRTHEHKVCDMFPIKDP